MKKMMKIACLFAAVCPAAAASAGCAPEAPSEGGEYYTVAFDSRGGTAVESQRVLSGNPVRRPETPVREGYYLDGWFTDADAAGEETQIVVPAEYNGLPVTAIQGEYGTGAFARSSVTVAYIPDSVEVIGQNTFHNCADLVSVVISAGSRLTEIGNNAFSGCSSLQSFYVPAGVESIGEGAFNNCGGLEAFTASFRPFSKAICSQTKGYIPFPRAGRAAGTGRITDCGRAIRRSILRGICILPLPGSRPRRPASPTGFRKSFPQRPHKD